MRTGRTDERDTFRGRDVRPDEAIRRPRGRQGRRAARSARLRLRLSRSKRSREDDAHPDAARADARDFRIDAAARADRSGATGVGPAGSLEFRGRIPRLVDHGRTVMLSSHLLDEVEKTCDAVAIVDRGQVVMQGTIAELRDSGGTQVVIEADPIDRARILLASSRTVSAVSDDGSSLRARLTDPDAVADLNRRLVEAGIAVSRLEPVQASLEQRFLEIKERFEEAAWG